MATGNGGFVGSWRTQSAYLYVLNLDGLALAWEYLRRNAAYCSQWQALGRGSDGTAWGLRCCR